MTTSGFFFHYIFSQYTHYWNIGLTWTTPATGAIILICFNFKLQTCIMTEVKILSWRRINCMLILYFFALLALHWWHVDDSDHLFHESFSLVKAMKRSDKSIVRSTCKDLVTWSQVSFYFLLCLKTIQACHICVLVADVFHSVIVYWWQYHDVAWKYLSQDTCTLMKLHWFCAWQVYGNM